MFNWFGGTKVQYLGFAALSLGAVSAQAAFFDDAKGQLTLRNYYFERNFVGDSATQNRSAEWAQGGIFTYSSGYTDTTVGVALETIAQGAFKLDGGRGTYGSNLLPTQDDKQSPDSYGRAGVALELKYGSTELKIGEQFMDIPMLHLDPARLLLATYQGVTLTSKPIQPLDVFAGSLSQVSMRDSTNMQSLGAFGYAGVTSDRFDYYGLHYRLRNQKTLFKFWQSKLHDIYQQNYAAVEHNETVGNWLVRGRAGVFWDREEGQGKLGDLNNKTFFTQLVVGTGPHTAFLGLQKLTGKTGWMSVAGSNASELPNDMFNGGMFNARESSFQVRYDYNFRNFGLPGLTTMVRYGHGYGIETDKIHNGREWERDEELSYKVQGGQFKDLHIRLNHSSNRKNFATGFDQTRLIVAFPIDL